MRDGGKVVVVGMDVCEKRRSHYKSKSNKKARAKNPPSTFLHYVHRHRFPDRAPV
jgi:hypothetical protein